MITLLFIYSSVVECWTVLAQDPVLSVDIIEQFLQILRNTPLCDEQVDRDRLRIAVLPPLAVSINNYDFICSFSSTFISCQRYLHM